MSLTKKQETFARELVKTDNQSESYRIAYNSENMSDKQVWEEASKLAKSPKVTQRIDELRKVAADVAKRHFQIDSKEILGHLNILRKARIDEYVDFVETVKTVDGEKVSERVLSFKPFDQLTEEQLMCIESIKETRHGIELKLHGKDWTIDKINKHIGFYGEHNFQKNGVISRSERLTLISELKKKLDASSGD